MDEKSPMARQEGVAAGADPERAPIRPDEPVIQGLVEDLFHTVASCLPPGVALAPPERQLLRTTLRLWLERRLVSHL
ncbi:MAG: hypothetical protein QJR14_09625 [Bacillota bacterium]|nr:hypothetical protein [Bacillota bacterium]